MKKRLFSFILVFLFVLNNILPIFPANAQSSDTAVENDSVSLIPEDSDYIEGTVLVTMAAPDGAPLTKEGRTSFDSHISVEKSYNFGDASNYAESSKQKDFLSDKTLYVSELSSSSYTTEELIRKLEQKAYVMQAEPDYEQYLNELDGDPYTDEQWYLDGGGNFSGTSTGISFSTSQTKTKTRTPVIAVMDTGIDYNHEDLAGHMWVNSNIALPGIHGYDFTEDTPYCMDTDGHGTHCAGSIAAVSGNQKGISGISDAKLMALKIFDDEGKTTNSRIFAALNYLILANSLGVNVVAVNCSWGGGKSSSLMPSLIKRLGKSGTLFIFASGNDGVNHDLNSDLTCPYDLYRGLHAENRNYIIITGASDINDNPADFSDYGTNDVDLFAPGEKILSTYTDDTYFPGIYDEATESSLTAEQFTFDTEQDMVRLYTSSDLGLHPGVKAGISLDSTMDYRSRNDSGALKWSLDYGIPKLTPKSSYLYLDVTDQNLDIEDTYYVSMLFGGTDSDGFFTWDHVVKTSSGKPGTDGNRFYTAPDGRIYFKIIGLETKGTLSGVSHYYIDDIGISRANPDTTLFGRYEAINGTSMAAPMVTGAVALLSQIYPADSSTDRRNRLLGCVRPSAGTASKCRTGGVLDLTNMDTYAPIPAAQTPETTDDQTVSNEKDTTQKTKIKVSKIKIRTSKKTIKVGKRLKLAVTISPSNASSKKVKWSSSKKKWASVSAKGIVTAKKKGRGHTVTITATATDGSRKKASIKIRIKK